MRSKQEHEAVERVYTGLLISKVALKKADSIALQLNCSRNRAIETILLQAKLVNAPRVVTKLQVE
jgi:hypothetical protein